jgi:hypothetical protein
MQTYYPNRSLETLSTSDRRTLEVGSAISREVLKENSVRTITHGSELPEGFSGRQRKRVPGVLFTVTRPNGKTDWIYRPNAADPERLGLKYEARCKALGSPGNVLAIPAGQRHLVDDVGIPVVFVEGIKKMLSIVSAARQAGAVVLVVAISGVWNWLSDGKPISDMLDIPVEGRNVNICFDSDVFRNPDVSDAARRFAGHLLGRGAVVYLSYLPDQADGSKQGADDFLAGGHSYRELMALMRLYNPRDLQAERLNRGEQIRFMLEDLRRAFWAAEFKGMGGHSARDLYKVLIDAALDRGKLHADGLRVKISRGELARMSKVSTRTLQKAIERLEEMGLIYRDNENRKQRERGAFVLRAKVNRYREGLANTPKTADGKTEATLSSLQLRAPRLMWSSPKVKARRGLVKGTRMVRQGVRSEPRPAIKRLGKTRGAILDALDAGGGILTLQEIADALHRKRARDLRRRSLPMLEEAGIITVEGDVVTLAEDWLDRLEDTRELGGEIEAEEHARRRYRDKSRAYHNRQQVEPTRHYVNILGADGHIEDLEHIAEALSEADSRTLEAIEAFERKYGRGSFRWDRASCKELFYSSRGGIWPEPEELRRIRDYLTATRGEAA